MSENTSLVLRLQYDTLDIKISVSHLLRVAKVIASKLGLDEDLVWIDRELNGYYQCPIRDYPNYRIIIVEPMGLNPNGVDWSPINFDDPQNAHRFSNAPIAQPLGELENGLSDQKRDVFLPYSPEMKKLLLDSLGLRTDVRAMAHHNQIWGIIDAVRNAILHWSLELEKAKILGEKMSFTEKEKSDAQSNITQIFHIQNQNVGVWGNVTDQAQVTNNQTSISLDMSKVKGLLAQIEPLIQQLPKASRDEIVTLLGDVKNEVAKPSPDHGKVKAFLTSIKTIAEGVAGNVIASGITYSIAKLLGVA